MTEPNEAPSKPAPLTAEQAAYRKELRTELISVASPILAALILAPGSAALSDADLVKRAITLAGNIIGEATLATGSNEAPKQ
jgi:hypothetical protein